MPPTTEATEVAFPAMKAASAIGAGAGTSILSTAMANPTSFFPTDFGGWAAAIASTCACLYTLHLLGEWWWKKFWKGFFYRRGWIKR